MEIVLASAVLGALRNDFQYVACDVGKNVRDRSTDNTQTTCGKKITFPVEPKLLLLLQLVFILACMLVVAVTPSQQCWILKELSLMCSRGTWKICLLSQESKSPRSASCSQKGHKRLAFCKRWLWRSNLSLPLSLQFFTPFHLWSHPARNFLIPGSVSRISGQQPRQSRDTDLDLVSILAWKLLPRHDVRFSSFSHCLAVSFAWWRWWNLSTSQIFKHRLF